MSSELPLLVVSTSCPAGSGPEVSVAAAAKLKGAAKVLVDADERSERVIEEVEDADKEAGGNASIDEDNLEQVT